jgi:hypothetical protein
MTGCGEEGGNDASGAAGASSEANRSSITSYLRQANAACRKARIGLKKEVSDFVDLQQGRKPPPLYYADLAHYVLLPKIEDELEAVRELDTTPEIEDGVEVDYLLYLKEIPLNQIATSKTVSSLAAIDGQFVKAGRVLRKHGLTSCARGPEAEKLVKGKEA